MTDERNVWFCPLCCFILVDKSRYEILGELFTEQVVLTFGVYYKLVTANNRFLDILK